MPDSTLKQLRFAFRLFFPHLPSYYRISLWEEGFCCTFLQISRRSLMHLSAFTHSLRRLMFVCAYLIYCISVNTEVCADQGWARSLFFLFFSFLNLPSLIEMWFQGYCIILFYFYLNVKTVITSLAMVKHNKIKPSPRLMWLSWWMTEVLW